MNITDVLLRSLAAPQIKFVSQRPSTSGANCSDIPARLDPGMPNEPNPKNGHSTQPRDVISDPLMTHPPLSVSRDSPARLEGSGNGFVSRSATQIPPTS